MISVAVVGLGWWGRNVVGLLAESDRLRPVLGVDVAPEGRAVTGWAPARVGRAARRFLHDR